MQNLSIDWKLIPCVSHKKLYSKIIQWQIVVTGLFTTLLAQLIKTLQEQDMKEKESTFQFWQMQQSKL